MSSARLTFLPEPSHMTQAQVDAFLGRQVREDAVRAGSLAACVRKRGRGKDSVFYATRDVKAVSASIAAGEYPGQKPLKEEKR